METDMNIRKIESALADVSSSIESIADQIDSAMDFELISDDEEYEDRFDDLMEEMEKLKAAIAEQVTELRALID
jgi:peptidoglycan hydrolase CwlO-like protein